MSERVEKLIEKMTLEEKARQLTQVNAVVIHAEIAAEVTGAQQGIEICREDAAGIGSVLNFDTASEAIAIQDEYLNASPHAIPLIFMQDVVHGYRTIFPIPLAIGCSFDPALAEECAKMSAVEAKYGGTHVTFSPMVDLVRDARWGRVMETTGEDVFLNCEMGRAFVRGYHEGGILCCVKHFAAYGAAEAGRDYNTTDVSVIDLKEYYLPAYRACVEEGADLVMSSFNLLNGIPVNGHRELLVDTLRDEWGFDGVLISDYGAVTEMIVHGYLESEKECAETAIRNGLDMEMMSPTYIRHLPELVKEGKVSQKLVDESLRRVLEMKEKAGLFENRYGAADPQKAEEVSLSPEHRAIARRAAVRSAVLLKNEGVLPLSEDREFALAGPFAEEKYILGNWACHGRAEEAVSIKEGLESALGRNLVSVTGCGKGISETCVSDIPAALAKLSGINTVIACIGEPSDNSGEGASRADISIPPAQAALVKALKEAGHSVVAVIFGGRPQVLTEIEPYCDAILYVWQPGTEGGNAVADLLLGKEEPTARLSMSFPRAVGQCPLYYNSFNTGRPRIPDTLKNSMYVSAYRDVCNAPLYPFGYGLGYTDWHIGGLRLSSDVLEAGGSIRVSARLKNTGSRAGSALVQLYIRDRFASVVRPVKELKGFCHVFLAAGTEEDVAFTISEEMLRFYTASGEYGSEAGKFDVWIGLDSSTDLSAEFTLVK